MQTLRLRASGAGGLTSDRRAGQAAYTRVLSQRYCHVDPSQRQHLWGKRPNWPIRNLTMSYAGKFEKCLQLVKTSSKVRTRAHLVPLG